MRAVRTARGLTLRDVAHQSGIDPGYLSKVERGKKQLSLESLHRLAVVLDLRELAALLKPYLLTETATPAVTENGGAGSSHPTPPVENGQSTPALTSKTAAPGA